MTEKFTHIHQVLVDCGYPESHDSGWYIQIEDHEGSLLVPHWYDCGTEARAKAAVKSLLNKTGIYEVTVFSPNTNPTSYWAGWSAVSERDWDWYIHRPNT